MKSNKGFTLIELLIVVAIIGIIAAIAILGLLRARQSGNEASGIGSMRAVNSAQATFAASCANGFYADSLDTLSLAPAGGTPFIGRDLNTDGVVKSTYAINVASTVAAVAAAPPACVAGGLFPGYTANADPQDASMRRFGTNTSGTIFFAIAAAPIAMDNILPPAGATPIQ